MYTDWLNFQSECKKSRAEAERQVAIKKRKQIDMFLQVLSVIGVLVFLGLIVMFLIIFM